MKMVALSVAGFGIFGCLPVFWTFPTAFLSGAAAAGGIALINSIGNLAGFAGPYAMGRIKDVTGSYTGGLLSLAGGRTHRDDHRSRARPRSLARTGVRRGHRGLKPTEQSGGRRYGARIFPRRPRKFPSSHEEPLAFPPPSSTRADPMPQGQLILSPGPSTEGPQASVQSLVARQK